MIYLQPFAVMCIFVPLITAWRNYFAREYGIPCVRGINNTTKLIKDEVDGSSGIVRNIFGEKDDMNVHKFFLLVQLLNDMY